MGIASYFSGDGLRGRSLRSAFFTALDFGSQNVLRLGGNLILTRILFPEAFGIMALVTVVMTGLRMFSDTGVRLSIIQHPRGNDPMFLDTAWMLQIVRGIVLLLATWAIAGPAARFYEAPILAQLLPVAGLAAVFQGLTSTKLATANRDLTLGRVTAINVGARMVGLFVLILLALVWESVWALVVGGLVAPFIIMILSHWLMPGHRNRFRFEREAARDLVGFGKYIFLSTMAGFLILQADRAILGKYVSLSELALYSIAIMFATLPRLVQSRMFDQVLMPLYSKSPPAESPRNYRNIARARALVVGGSLAPAAILALFGDLLIRLLYDARYETAGPLLVLMSVAALPGLVVGGYSSMIVARGHSARFAAFITLSAILRTSLLLVAIAQYGLVGAALTPFVATILFYPAMLWFIAPYKGWVPAQDLIFGLASAGVSALAIWLNYEALRGVFALFP